MRGLRRLLATGGRKEVVRYYVLETSEDPKVKMFIVAEVVREIDENTDDRADGLAGQIAGTRALILSGAEILLMGEGARILHEWDFGDDENFDAESERIALAPDSEEAIVLRHLRLVKAQKDQKDESKGTNNKDS